MKTMLSQLLALLLLSQPLAAQEPIFRIPPGEEESTNITLAFSSMPADWSVEYMKLAEAWKKSTGKGVKVCVLDTGVDHDHSAWAGVKIDAKDYTGSRTGTNDINGHGTHCRGIVMRVAPDAVIGCKKVLGDGGSGSSTGIARAIRDAADEGYDVASCSFGSGSPDTASREAIKYATAKGMIVVCAAGNSGPRENTVGYPGAYPESISIAAIQPGGSIASYSSRGKENYVCAPGSNIVSTYPGNRYATLSGTSMACPFVAGVGALWISSERANGRVPTEPGFRAVLARVARDMPPPGRDTASGHGLTWVIDMLEAGPIIPPPPPPPAAVGFKIELSDLTVEARARVLNADPAFKSITLERSK